MEPRYRCVPREVLVILAVTLTSTVLLPTRAVAQNTTATVTGLVLDNQKLAVTGAAVVVADSNRGFTRSTTTGQDGTFEIAGLQPGEFRLKASLHGFTSTQIDLRLEVNQRLRLDVVLQPGGVAEDVVVHQTAPLLDTVSSSVGQVIGEEQISQLPLNGRQFLELAMLVPGAHTSHGASDRDDAPLTGVPARTPRSASPVAARAPMRSVSTGRPTPIRRSTPTSSTSRPTRSANSRSKPRAIRRNSARPARAR